MLTEIPAQLLLRMLHATPDQLAAVHRIFELAPEQKAEAVEPAGDAVALKLFALVKALESESNYRKAPVTRVFQLYCLEAMTCRQIAKACRCAPSLVAARLKTIEIKLGRKPDELRTLSSEFERIADSLTDSRARRIRRQSAIEDGDVSAGF